MSSRSTRSECLAASASCLAAAASAPDDRTRRIGARGYHRNRHAADCRYGATQLSRDREEINHDDDWTFITTCLKIADGYRKQVAAIDADIAEQHTKITGKVVTRR